MSQKCKSILATYEAPSIFFYVLPKLHNSFCNELTSSKNCFQRPNPIRQCTVPPEVPLSPALSRRAFSSFSSRGRMSMQAHEAVSISSSCEAVSCQNLLLEQKIPGFDTHHFLWNIYNCKKLKGRFLACKLLGYLRLRYSYSYSYSYCCTHTHTHTHE